MKIEQIYTGCLAEAAYYIESDGEAVIIDPMREVDPYIEKAHQNGATIKYILETHFHADFVSGHLDLARKTGATIVYGPNAETGFEKHSARDGEELKVGRLTLKVLHTPGHTPESTSYLLLDEQNQPHAIFTGDTLFIGDVGRPDLAVKTDLSREDLAGMLFDSLRNKIMPLPDNITVYPAHGAGSACGKNLSSDTWDTLGNQKKTNYALRADMSKEEFIREVTAGIMPPPQYFPKNAAINRQGYNTLESTFEKGQKALSADHFEQLANSGALMLDTRTAQQFAKGHIPNAINIGLDGQFAGWVGTLIPDLHQPIVIVCEEGKRDEVITRLARVGYTEVEGYLDGGFPAWEKAGKEVATVTSIPAEEFARRYTESGHKLQVLDVRKPTEYLSEHLELAVNVPLDYVNREMGQLDPNREYYIHCAAGYRSMVFSSILKSRGFHNLVDIQGGFKAIQNTDLKRTNYVCPSELDLDEIAGKYQS